MAAKERNVTASISHKGDIYYIVVSHYVGNKRKLEWVNTHLKVSGNNKRRVEQKRLEVLEEWRKNSTPNDNSMLFTDYLKSWLEETKHQITLNTYYSYRQTIYNSICPYFEERKITLRELKPFHIQEFYTYKMDVDGVSANTIRHYQANIRKALQYAVKTERLNSNPASADRIELPKMKKHKADFYTVDELKSILDYSKGSSIETVVFLAVWFGMRRGEIAGLKWSDIDFNNKVLHITGTVIDKGLSGSKIKNLRYEPYAKTDSSIRSLSMMKPAIEYLQKVKADQDMRRNNNSKAYNHEWDEFVCVRDNGDLIPLEYISRKFPKLCEKAGLKRLTLHGLRHSNITALLEAGETMTDVSDFAGHNNVTTTINTYSHVTTRNKIKLAETLERILS